MTPHADRPFLAGALDIARRLYASHSVDRWGPGWEGEDLQGEHAETATVVRRRVAADLYAGRAGIGWFLVHAGVEGRDRAITALGLSALQAALAEADDAADLSLYCGLLGVVLAARQGARCAASTALDAAAGIAAERWCARVQGEPAPPTSDLLGGAAGQLWGLHLLRDKPRGASAAALMLARRVHAAAQRTTSGVAWPDAASSTGLCGMAHGNSGIALGLLAAGALLKDPRHARLAEAASMLERSRFDIGQANWPDLRDGRRAFMQAWCHGGIGIGAQRLVWHRATARLDALADATIGLIGARAVVMAAGAAIGRGDPSDVTPCHGLAGAVELFVLAHAFSAQREHALAAARGGQLLLQALRRDIWRPGLAGTTSVPGLMIGLAGVGATLLRVHRRAAIGSPLLAGAAGVDVDRLRSQPAVKTQPSGSAQRTPRSDWTAAM